MPRLGSRRTLIGGGSAAWLPSRVSGLALWLRADTGVFTDAAMTTPAVNDTDAVQGWQDQSGNARHFTQATAGKIPTLKTGANGINGRSVVRFDGGDLLVNATAFLIGQTGLMIVVCKPQAGGGSNQAVLSSADEASTERFLRCYLKSGATSKPGVGQNNSDTADNTRNGTALYDTQAYVLAYQSDGATTNIAMDKHADVLVVTGGSDNGDWFADTSARDNTTLGGSRTTSDSSYMTGDIAELLVYEPLPSSDDIASITNYLVSRYGIAQYEKTTLAQMEAVGLYDCDNPAIPAGAPGSADYRIRENGNILYEPADTGAEYKTWYTGFADDFTHFICYAYSSDGKTWTKSASNPVIDARTCEDPYVLKVGATYYCYVEDVGLGAPYNVRRWSSGDLVNWTDEGRLTGIEAQQPASPTVWIEDGTWYMLYEALVTAPYTTRLATSEDGLAWADDAANPVFTINDMDWSFATRDDAVPDDIIKIDGIYYFTYHTHDILTNAYQGIATSSDLTTWTDGSHNPLGYYSTSGLVSTFMYCDDGEISLFGITGNGTNPIMRGYPVRRTN